MSSSCSPTAANADARLEEAIRHRERLHRVVGIAVTGSCGKTTTKDLIAEVLGTRFRGTKSEDTKNCGVDVCDTILTVRPDDNFVVQELGAWGPGTLEAGLNLFRPHVGVVTCIRNDHYSAFHGPLGAQTEKANLVRCLPPTGTAVLNWDDALVRAMAEWTDAKTFSFGRDGSADLRACDVSSAWPDPLSFTATYRDETVRVRTQLFGEHLLGSALAALAVGVTFGLSLADAAAALASAEPTYRRMSVVRRPDGVTIIRDDWKAPADSFSEIWTFVSGADAARKIAVVGTVSDYPGRSRPIYSQIAWNAMRVLDAVVFVGSRAADLWGLHDSESADAQRALRASVKAKVGTPGPTAEGGSDPTGKMFVLGTVRDAHVFLERYLKSGDLLLIKGSGPADHLERLILASEVPVSCWLTNCGRVYPCHMCELLLSPSPPDGRCGG